MRPVLLKLDDALDRQDALTAAAKARGGRVLCARDLGPSVRLWSRAAPLRALGRRLVGADVVGDWSTPACGHRPLARLKRAEAILDLFSGVAA